MTLVERLGAAGFTRTPMKGADWWERGSARVVVSTAEVHVYAFDGQPGGVLKWYARFDLTAPQTLVMAAAKEALGVRIAR